MLVGGFNYVLNPTLLTDFRFSFVRYRVNVQSLDYGKNTGEAAGIPGVNVAGRPDTSGLPRIPVDGNGGFREGFGLDIGQCNCPLHEREWVLQFVNTWTKLKGNHTIKWGTDIRRAQNIRARAIETRNGEFTFSPVITASADVRGSGSGSGRFHAGNAQRFSRFWQTVTDFPEDYQWRMFYFVQDTWRVTTKLTLSYGLRWDTWFPDQSTLKGGGSRYNVVTNNFEIVGYGDNGQAANIQTQWHNFSPRFAIAYAMNEKTVIRTGWGRSYLRRDLRSELQQHRLQLPDGNHASRFRKSIRSRRYSCCRPDRRRRPLAQIPSNGLLPLPRRCGSQLYSRRISSIRTWIPGTSQSNGCWWRHDGNCLYVGNVGRHEQFGIPLNQAVPGPGPFDPRRPLYRSSVSHKP